MTCVRYTVRSTGIVALFLAINLPVSGHARVYQLTEYSTPGEYGYSGTIRTDGSTGSFSNTSAIIDWHISLVTPGEKDGDTSTLLTASNSNVRLSDVGLIEIHESRIALPFRIGSPSRLFFELPGPGDSLGYIGPYLPMTPGVISVNQEEGVVVVIDEIGPQSFEGIGFRVPGTEFTLVAIAIPEPDALFTAFMAGVLCISTRISKHVVAR